MDLKRMNGLWALIWFALRIEVISEEEYKWLDAATDCLGRGGVREKWK